MCFIIGFSSCRRGDSDTSLQWYGLKPAALGRNSPRRVTTAIQTPQCVLAPVSTNVDQIILSS